MRSPPLSAFPANNVPSCSLKTPENIACVKSLPLDKLLIESDCPWCEIRPSHASYPFLVSLPPALKTLYMPAAVKKEKWTSGKLVKGRSEPISTAQVAWVVAQLQGVSLEEVAETTTRNARELFGFPETDKVVVSLGEEDFPSLGA